MQVNAVVKNLNEDETTLDDKNFLTNLSWSWTTPENAKIYLFSIFQCRVLFDKYILKREYARDYKESGKWSLQQLSKYVDSTKNEKPKYIGIFGGKIDDNKRLRTLQSCLRITYTSPKTMHWISIVLLNLLENIDCDLIKILENYCSKKIISSDYKNKKGFNFERIVFSYLDYLLYRNGYNNNGIELFTPLQDDWQFQFRNSIEHFQPQNPGEGETWIKEELDEFGNLALITVSGNSKFSNLPPAGKINSYPSIFDQSLKLKIMREVTNLGDGKWTKEKANEHKIEMFKILEANI